MKNNRLENAINGGKGNEIKGKDMKGKENARNGR